MIYPVFLYKFIFYVSQSYEKTGNSSAYSHIEFFISFFTTVSIIDNEDGKPVAGVALYDDSNTLIALSNNSGRIEISASDNKEIFCFYHFAFERVCMSYVEIRNSGFRILLKEKYSLSRNLLFLQTGGNRRGKKFQIKYQLSRHRQFLSIIPRRRRILLPDRVKYLSRKASLRRQPNDKGFCNKQGPHCGWWCKNE